MNRAQRRSQKKALGGELKYLESPCSINEAVQIARGVAEDVVMDYQRHTGHIQVATTLQLEILKDIVIKAGLITEEEFRSRYIEQAKLFEEMQRSREENEETAENPAADTKVDMNVGEIEVETETV